MRIERKGGCALSVALWSLCCRGLWQSRIGVAKVGSLTQFSSRSLAQSTHLYHLFDDISQFTSTSQLHVVDHATSIDPRCTLFSL